MAELKIEFLNKGKPPCEVVTTIPDGWTYVTDRIARDGEYICRNGKPHIEVLIETKDAADKVFVEQPGDDQWNGTSYNVYVNGKQV